MARGEDRVGHSAASHAPPEALFSLVVDLTDDAVVSCDASSTVTFFSESAERLSGRPATEIVGASVRTLFPAHLADEMSRLFATVMAGECIRHFESEIVRPDGLPTPISLSLAPLPNEETATASAAGTGLGDGGAGRHRATSRPGHIGRDRCAP